MTDPYSIIYHPFVTEKVMSSMETNNTLEFIVRRTANKIEIKKAIEEMFDVKIKNVTTRIQKDGKHAIVTFMPEYHSEDIGMRIGVF